jgi:ATP-dependent Lon protease
MSTDRLPVLPLGRIVVYPHVVVPLSLDDPGAVAMIDEVVQGDQRLILGAVKAGADHEVPEGSLMEASPVELHPVGTLGAVVRMMKLPEGAVRVMVMGLDRVRLVDVAAGPPWLTALPVPVELTGLGTLRTEALKRNVLGQFTRVIDLAPHLGPELHGVVAGIDDPGKLADFVAANLDLRPEAKAELLCLADVTQRLDRLAGMIAEELEVLEVGSQIQDKVNARLDRHQREYVLREQLNVIREELGEAEAESEMDDLGRRLAAANLPAEARKAADRELKRLRSMSPQTAEYQVARTYLETMASLPWSRESEDRIDLEAARRILDRDHYDLKQVKERILEHLAVRRLNPEARGSILCFVGPPGVGKTSLGQSIAEALGRRFARVSLGGVQDEAAIRGHRRTYVGALPGRILQALARSETRNPLLMLDEVDKIGADPRGDPTAALLEVLDPAQNHAFADHYLEVPFDLSGVLFIATANSLAPMVGPLRDRMEVIVLPGYTPSEKLTIARRFLLPRQLKEAGLTNQRAGVTDGALERLIAEYTREAGVRQLEREIGGILRKVALRVVEGRARNVRVTPRTLEQFAGQPAFQSEVAGRAAEIGVATGLAWTPVGGEIIFIEAIQMPGRGQVTLTGQLGEVMRESAQAAWSLLRARAEALGIPPRAFAESDVHVHIPAGAVPKDGPSAGIVLAAALASLLCRRPVRHDVAMTGELTLRGRVLPVGGLREKVTAAVGAGMRTVLVPARNRGDLEDLPPDVKDVLKIRLVDTIDEVLELALLAPRRPATARERATATAEARP